MFVQTRADSGTPTFVPSGENQDAGDESEGSAPVSPGPTEANVDAGNASDTSVGDSGVTPRSTSEGEPRCGNGTVEEPEECDDGNDIEQDGCSSCVVEPGYMCDTAIRPSACADQDECSDNTHNCHEVATCTNSQGTFSCSCRPGWSGDGVDCVDDDECEMNAHNCDANASCSNTEGSFTCACNSEYTGDGFSCVEEMCAAGQTRGPDGGCVSLPRCDPAKPFGLPFPVAQINLPNFRESATMTHDGLTLYVQYGQDVYAAKRQDLDDTFGAPEQVTQFASILSEYPNARLQVITADELELYFYEGFRYGGIYGGLFSASRDSASVPFTNPVERTDLNFRYESDPDTALALNGIWMSADENRVYGYTMISYRLVFAERRQSAFLPGILVDGGIEQSTYNVALTPDELKVYSGNRGIFRAERAQTELPFGAYEQAVDLGTLWTDPIWISPDDCELVLLVFDADLPAEDFVEGASPNDGVFIARRPL